VSFRGQFEHNIDGKGRITVPSRFREALVGPLVLSPGLDKCIAIYPQRAYEEFEKAYLATIDPLTREGRLLQRKFHARSVEDELDSAGRVRLAQHLVEYADLEGSCIVVGVMDHLELWRPDLWVDEADQLNNL
jgi:MraZ protein